MSEHRTSKYARSSSWAAIRETCSYERDQLQSIHMGAISICTVRDEAASKWRQPKETTIWICVRWVVTNEAFVCCIHTASFRFCAACRVCVCVVVAVALSRLLCATDLFSCRSLLSHYLQLRSTRCAYAFVLVSMPRQTKIKPFEIYVAVFCALSVHLALRGSWIPTQISFKHNIVWLVHSSVGFNNSIETYGMRDGKTFLSASLFARFS